MHRRIETRILNPLLGTAEIPLPKYETEGSAALDLRACIPAAITIPPGGRHLVGSGFGVNIMDPGLAAFVASRSGQSLKKGVHVAQGLGVIDADYHGEIGVILENRSTEVFKVQPGDRIAQLLFMPVVQVALDFVEAFSTTTKRGEGGFGSTGHT